MQMRGKPNQQAYWPNGLPGPDIENGENPVVITTALSGYDRQKQDFVQTNADTFTQYLPNRTKPAYLGTTIMLIDERTVSQAEHTGLFFKAANSTIWIGSATTGANGDITSFNIPGGGYIIFTGQAVTHINGKQLQRVGLIPDLEVHPTIQGIREGRDEILEAAMAYLNSVLEK